MTNDARFFELLIPMLENAHAKQRAEIEEAALQIAACVQAGGMVYTFGTGHAHMLSLEVFYRAGGLACVCPMLDERLMLHVSASASSAFERTEGIAKEVFDRYDVRKGDVVIIASNSGRNCAPVQMALLAKARGAYTIALTSLAHSRAVTPRNPYGKRLFEVCDLVIDNMGVPGDAVLATASGASVSPTSTVIGAALLEAIVARVAELAKAEFFVSSNVDGGDAINKELIEKYKSRVRCL